MAGRGLLQNVSNAMNRPSADASLILAQGGASAASLAAFNVDLDLDSMFDVARNGSIGNDSFEQTLSRTANSLSRDYIRTQNKLVGQFMEAAANNPTLASLVDIVPDPTVDGMESPKFIIVCRGALPSDVKPNRVMNALLVNWFYSCKKKNGEPIAASSWSTHVKTRLATLKQSRRGQLT